MSLNTYRQLRVLPRFNGTLVHYEHICRAMTRDGNSTRPVTASLRLIECFYPTSSENEICAGRDWWIEKCLNIVSDQG
jgi:hypothetical protein